jgi:dihydroorotase
VLTVDDWAGCCHNFCKPVAKFPKDREALRQVIKEGHPRFFLGTDSAPHPKTAKENATAAAGVFITPYVGSYLAEALDSFGALERMTKFCSEYGRAFYGMPASENRQMMQVCKEDLVIPKEIFYTDDQGNQASVVPFLAGKTLSWTMKKIN